MAAKEFIVAIELGSSKITGIAGKKSMDGSIQVLAVVKEDATFCIRKGVVYNIDKTCACLTNIIKKLKKTLKSEISKVYVGVGGQSIRSIRNTILKTLPEDGIITQEMLNELMDNNRSTYYPDLEILDAATLEYKVGTQYQVDPVGILSNKIEGNFLNIVCRKAFFRNLNKCFEKANITIADMYLAPIALADSVLTDAEKRSGCLLVDMGADTTTVSVYFKNILRHLAVIPLGGNDITKDITSLMMEENEAEEMKVKYATAYTEPAETNTQKTLPIDDERSVSVQTFNELVEARINEIIQNVWFGQVPPEYNNKLLGGIILTGGGSNMKDIKKAFTAITGIQKIRIADTVRQKVSFNDKNINAHDGMMNTALGLLAKGDINCAGSTIQPATDLFAPENRPNTTVTDTPRPQNSKHDVTVQEKPSTQKPNQTSERPNRNTPNHPKDKRKGNWFSKGFNYLQELGLAIITAEGEEDDDKR